VFDRMPLKFAVALGQNADNIPLNVMTGALLACPYSWPLLLAAVTHLSKKADLVSSPLSISVVCEIDLQ